MVSVRTTYVCLNGKLTVAWYFVKVEKERLLERDISKSVQKIGLPVSKQSEEESLIEADRSHKLDRNNVSHAQLDAKIAKENKKATRVLKTESSASPHHQPRTNPFDNVSDEERTTIDHRNPFEENLNPFTEDLTNPRNSEDTGNPFLQEDIVTPRADDYSLNPFAESEVDTAVVVTNDVNEETNYEVLLYVTSDKLLCDILGMSII